MSLTFCELRMIRIPVFPATRHLHMCVFILNNLLLKHKINNTVSLCMPSCNAIRYIRVGAASPDQLETISEVTERKLYQKQYKMKLAMFIFTLLAALCATLAYVPPVQRPSKSGNSFPTFPGHGPFNPKVQWPYPRPTYQF